jgi:hypothetical protein
LAISPDLGLRANRNLNHNGSEFEQRLEIPVQAGRVEKGVLSMTYIPTQTSFMNLEDSEKLLRAIFPNYPSLEPCHRPPSLEPITQGCADRGN